MSGLTKAQWEARLADYLACESAILRNQAYTIGSRSMTRANLAEVRSGIAECNEQLQRLSRTGMRVRYGMPL
jgi:hypothetical protein